MKLFKVPELAPEEKIRAVSQYLNGNEVGKTIAKSIGVHPSIFIIFLYYISHILCNSFCVPMFFYVLYM